VIAAAGTVVPLTTILLQSFGTTDTPFGGAWLFPSKPFENTSTDVGYWATPNTTPEWFIGDKKVETPTFVADITSVTLHVGNQINNPASLQVRVTQDKSGPNAEWITYDVWTVDPAFAQLAGWIPGPPGQSPPEPSGLIPGQPRAPTPEAIVASAQAFAAIYGDGVILNTNLCNWIADNVAAGAGASMPQPPWFGCIAVQQRHPDVPIALCIAAATSGLIGVIGPTVFYSNTPVRVTANGREGAPRLVTTSGG
jgi:hypothetical protein